MATDHPHEASIFNAARKLASVDEREAFLTESCGVDVALRQRVEKLLAAFIEESQFLEQPASGFQATVLTGPDGNDRAASLAAGLAAAFTDEQAVVLGEGSHSVLKMLGQSLDKVPRVVLRDSVQEGADPIVRPKSAEIPKSNSDSRYQLQGEIARGGMGAILKGRDTDLGRDLAIKVLLDAHKDNPEVVQRFVEEAQIGGQLQHPGIAPVYELGAFRDKRPFFSMKLVKGETLSKLLADRGDAAADRGRFIGIFEQVCQTMAYAHSRGVIHRDLKPANIMVGAFGEVQVMDWGLAKVLQTGGVADEKKAHDQQQGQSIIRTLRSQVGSDPPEKLGTVGSIGSLGSQTQMGSVMGTPAYMPPEQALGEIDHLDERADVFGLGAILCEVLTGQPPYVAQDGTQVYRMASRGKLADCFARLEACGADAELIAIAKQCLNLEPQDRPRDAGALVERVTSYLASVESRLHAAELERAAEAARAEEALQTAKEHEAAARAERHARKLQMGLAAVVLCVMTIGGIAATWTAAVQSKLKNDALLAERTANKARQVAEDEQARAEREKSRAETEKTRAEVAQRLAEDEKTRSLNLLADMQTERGLQAGREGQGAKAALWFANAAALTSHDRERRQANQRRAQAWSGEAMLPVALLRAGHDAKRIEFQRSGSLLMTVDQNGLRVWDWRSEVALPWSEQLPKANDAALSPDGKLIVALLDTGEVRLLEPASGMMLGSFNAVSGMHSIDWSPDGARLAVAGSSLQIWNVSGEPKLESNWPHPAMIGGVRFSRSGTRVVSCSDDNRARVFAIDDATLPAPLYLALDHRQGIKCRETAPVFCDDDRLLVTLSSSTRQPALHDATTGTALPVDWKMADNFDRSLDVSPDGHWVAVGGAKDGVLLSADGKSSLILTHTNHLHRALFAPNGQSLATLSYEGIARLFPLRNLGQADVGVPTIIPQRHTFAGGAFSPDSHALAIVANQQVVIWERKPASPIVGQVRWPEDKWRPRPSFDGQLVAPGIYHEYYHAAGATGRQAELKVSRIVDGSAAGPAITLSGLLVDSCVCADNASVAAVGTDQAKGWLSLFDIATGTAKWKRLELPASPLSVAARPRRPQVAVLCENGDLLVVDTTRGAVELRQAYSGVSGPATFARVAYSPDGATIVTVMQNSVVSIRDAESGLIRCKSFNPMIAGGMTRSIAFSPDGRLLATAVTGKNMAQVWNLETGEKVGVDMSHPGDMFGIWSIAFSPDGTRLVTGHKDGRVRTFDWQTGEVVGSPLQHPDEVNDVAFTPDGRHLLACVRQGTVHVWDVATGKLAVPLLPQLKPDTAGASTQVLAVAGHRAVVSASGLYSVLDLTTLLPPIEEDVPSLLRRAELATNQKLQVGELVPLESQEWSTRWEQLVAARQTPEQVAESLAQALDEAADASSQSLVIARASRRGLLDKLHTLRPKSTPLSLALALELSRQGRLDEALKQRDQVLELLRSTEGQLASRRSQGDVASQSLTQQAVEQAPAAGVLPLTGVTLSDVAELLTVDAPRGRWVPLEPTTMKGAAETTFMREPNGFILTNAGNSQPETYSIEGRASVKRIAALRLDVSPHASLPSGGAGHGGGNFCLTELRARVRRADGTETSLKLTGAAADYVRVPDAGTNETDGPWAVFDGDPGTRWDIFPHARQPHWLVLIPDAPCDIAGNDMLIVELDSGDRNYPDTRLGHFRLSVSEDSRAGLADELVAAVRRNDLHSDELLAAACLINGEAAIALNVLQHAALTDARITLPRALLLATAQQQLGKNDAAKHTVKDLLPNIVWKPLPHSLTGFVNSALRDFSGLTSQDVQKLAESQTAERELARLTQAIEASPDDHRKYEDRALYLARLGRWHECAEGYMQQLERADAEEWRLAMMKAATAHLFAGEHDAYRRLCERAIERFPKVNNVHEADVLTKVCLLMAGNVEMSKLPVQMVKEVAQPSDAKSRVPWFMACSALAAYRSGQLEEARDLSLKVTISQWSAYYSLAQSVRAMAEEKLGNREAALQALELAERRIHPQLSTFGKSSPNVAVPVAALNVHHDYLIAELLRREAALLIHKDEARTTTLTDSSTSNLKTSQEWAALGRWAEAAETSANMVASDPGNRVELSRLAALQLLAGDVEGYRQTCESGLTTFNGKLTTDEAESLSKTCLLGDSTVEHSRLPIQQVRDAIDDPKQATGRSFYVAVSALAAYRAGDWELVLGESQKITTFSDYTDAMRLVARAMAEEQLGQHEQALKSLAQAEPLFPMDLRTLGTAEYAGPLSVPDSVIQVDWLIVEVLRREAVQLIRESSILESPDFKQAARSEQLAMQGKWAEAAKAEEASLIVAPRDRGYFAFTAATLMMAGDVEGHRRFCDRALKPFEPVTAADVADSLCKACLLAPDAVSLERLPIKVLREGIADPKNEAFKNYLLACHTLVLHRTGQHAEAIAETKKIPHMANVVGALALVARAMAEEKLGQHEQAVRTLAEAERIIPVELRTLGSDQHKGKAVVPRDSISVDMLIPEVLRREAASLIHK